MPVRNLLTVAALLAAGPASAQLPHTFAPGAPARASEVNANFQYLQGNLPQVVYTRRCVEPNCQVTEVNTADSDRGVVATLDVPQGSYFVTAKLGAYLLPGTSVYQPVGGRLQCTLRDAANASTADYGAAGILTYGWSDAMVVMQVPMSFGAAGGTVQVACRADIPEVALPSAQAWVWGVVISAMRVASTTIE